MTQINKQTYYMTPDWFIGAACSISRATSGRYLLTKTEEKQGFYMTIEQQGITLKVPFRALFDTNDKIKPIVSLSFSSAIYCPSARLGFCQLTNNDATCYAKQGQKQSSGTHTSKGIPRMNSLRGSMLVMYCLKQLDQDRQTTRTVYNKFIEYLDQKVPVLRFNLKGDFKGLDDIKLLYAMVQDTKKTVFYGYTARDDLMTSINLLDSHKYFLNGSNEKYTNRFKACYDLEKWLLTSKICLGGCNKCRKCYTYKNQVILCLVHGTNQDMDLNTWNNRVFIAKLFNALNSPDSPRLTSDDLTVRTGLLDSLNWNLKNKLNIGLEFEDYWHLRDWLHSIHYEIQDNLNLVNDYEYLKSLGVA